MGAMRAQLMGAPRDRLQRQPGHLLSRVLHDRVIGQRMARAVVAMLGDEHLLARRPVALALRQIGGDAPLLRPRNAGNQRPVDFSRVAGAEGAREFGGREPGFGDHEHARGVLVDAVDKARLLAVAIGERGQHAVDMARDPRTALNREPHRLVQHEDVAVLVDGHLAKFFGVPVVRVRPANCGLCGRFAVLVAAAFVLEGRNPHDHPGGEPRRGLGARAVDADLAGAAELLQMPEGERRKPLLEPPVEPQSLLGLAHRDRLHAGRLARQRRKGPRRHLDALLDRRAPRRLGLRPCSRIAELRVGGAPGRGARRLAVRPLGDRAFRSGRLSGRTLAGRRACAALAGARATGSILGHRLRSRARGQIPAAPRFTPARARARDRRTTPRATARPTR